LLSMMTQQMACVLKVSATFIFNCHNAKILKRLCLKQSKEPKPADIYRFPL
jgi:hypothetical protein